MAEQKLPGDEIEADIAKAIIAKTLAERGRTTAGELKRAVESVLISAPWSMINRELRELEQKKLIEAEGDGLGGISYRLTKAGIIFAKSKEVRDALDILT